MTSQTILYEHRMTVKALRLKRLLILMPMALILMLIGYAMVPDGTFLAFAGNDISFFWHTFGHLLWFGGGYMIVSEVVRSTLARGNAGAWHIRLTPEKLLWQAPRQPYGREASFDFALSEIAYCEHRQDADNSQKQSYWIYPVDGTKIRLKDTSGVNLQRVFELLAELDVERRETET